MRSLCLSLLTGNTGEAHYELSLPPGWSGRSLHTAITSCQRVDGLVEDPDVVPLVRVGGPHANASNLVDLEDVGVLVPGAEVAALIKSSHSSHIRTAPNAGHRPQDVLDKVEHHHYTAPSHSLSENGPADSGRESEGTESD